MKIAFFCLEFPPINTTGNYRSAGFARYLLLKDVELLVFSVTEISGEKTFGKTADYSLMKGLEKARIYRYEVKPFRKFWRTKIGNALRIWWNVTDKISNRWFIGETKKEIYSILELEKPDFLYFSLPPFSTASLAVKIHKKTCIPLITDMRDAWSLWEISPHQTFFHYLKKKFLERSLFKNSEIILGVTPELIEDFKSQHPTIDPDKFKVVYNGYDDFGGFINKSEEDEIFSIGYVGSFYYSPIIDNYSIFKKIKNIIYYRARIENWLYRSPFFFLNTLSELINSYPDLREKVRFEYIGNAPDWFLNMINDLNLNDNFINHGFKSKQEVLTIQSSWSGILATSEKIENGNHFCLPSKIFDAVESRKRILAFVTDGSQKNFLTDYPQTVFFNPDDIVINVIKLGEVIKQGKNYRAKSIAPFFSRTNQSEILYNILNKYNYN